MCKENEHNYQPVGGSAYYKHRADGAKFFEMPRHDQSVSYKMVVCTKCGDAKEVIAQDHKAREQE